MDFGKAFTFVFDDEDWVRKVLIGGILGLIPVVNLIVLGYGLKVLKNVADGAEHPLPAWTDFGDYFVQGLMSFLGLLIWAAPLIILGILSSAIGWATGYDLRSDQSAWYYSGQACIWGLNCLSALYVLLLGIVMPAASTEYAISNEFGAFFRFGEIFKYITANLGNYVIALLLICVAQFIAGFGLILCCVGVLFTGFWATVVSSHLLGQVYRASETPSLEIAD
jgi:hypothetical protein